jgi:cellulose 1,4-beta-cellobiosidase
MWRANAVICGVTLLCAPLVQSVVPAAPAARSATVVTLCRAGEQRIVTSSGGRAYRIRNANWHGPRGMCISNRNLGTNFRETRAPGPDPRGLVVAYPDIFRGCLWHFCSPNAGIPIRARNIHHLKSTWHTRQDARGSWNAAYDLWFGKRRMITGQADGAELMIWLNRHGACCPLQPNAKRVRIDGHVFRLSHWRAHSKKWDVSWNYIQLRFVHPRKRVDGVRLTPIIHRCIRMGLLDRSWWLENVVAGFEVWRGGRGLGTTKFNVSLYS